MSGFNYRYNPKEDAGRTRARTDALPHIPPHAQRYVSLPSEVMIYRSGTQRKAQSISEVTTCASITEAYNLKRWHSLS